MIDAKWKIDLSGSMRWPFGAFHRRAVGVFWHRWKRIDMFDTRKEAREFIEAVKDLPEYL
jgi:hypothetical protein